MLGAGSLRLYRRLLGLGIVAWDEAPVEGADDPRLAELVSLGMARVTDDAIIVVPPNTARGQLAVEVYRQARDLLTGAADVNAFLEECAALDDTDAFSPDDVVQLVRDYSEVRVISGTLQRNARREVLAVHTAHLPLPSEQVNLVAPVSSDIAAGVSYRVIYQHEYATDDSLRSGIEAAVRDGEQARLHPDPPLKLKIIDQREALLPLDESAAAGALVVRSRPICAMLVDHFERLWKEATPFGHSPRPGHGLDPLQLRILRMLAKDMTDTEIANTLRISDRTLRRHVSVILNGLGVRTRAGAVASALHQGWLG